jgi:hypothetical protein
LPTVQHEIKKGVSGVDDNGAWRLVADVINDLANKFSGSVSGFLNFERRWSGSRGRS